MTTWNNTPQHYFSGQGVVLVARRSEDGLPLGFEWVGNVSALTIGAEVTSLEHKESHTGQRGTDLRLTQETSVSVSMTLENFVAENLNRVLRGDSTTITGGTVAALPLRAFAGKVAALDHLRVSSLVLTGETALTKYVDDNTPWDYKENLDAGSVQFNPDLSSTANLGQTPAGITVGATTVLDFGVAHTYTVGQSVYLKGFTGADAGDINDQLATITAVTEEEITINLNTATKTITVGAGTLVVGDGAPLTAAYTYAAQKQVDALTQGPSDLFMRFEGLNTAEGNKPVVVEVFRVQSDPLQELALIQDEIAQFVLEGNALADTTRQTGSKYFRIRTLD